MRELLLAARPARDASTACVVEAVLEASARDKKRVGASVPFVLVEAPGAVRDGCEVGRRMLRAAVAELAGVSPMRPPLSR